MRNRREVRSPSGHPWAGVEVRYLVALDTIGQEGSFFGAAQRLGYAQSSVSQQIANLERTVGTRLVERSRGQGPASLTIAGRRLAAHGGDIVARLIAARTDLATIAPEGHAQTVKVAVDRLIAPRVLPPLIRAAERALPDLSLVFSEVGEAEQAASLIAGGKVDAVLGELPPAATRFRVQELLRDPFVLLARADSLLACASDPPTLEQLAEFPLIGTAARVGTAGRGPEPVELTIALKTASVATAVRLVRSGLGFALVPRLAIDTAGASIAVVDLGEMLIPRRIGLYRDPYRRVTVAADRLCALSQRVLGALATSRISNDSERANDPLRDARAQAA
jgi:DNA-binding transcriptional LysR family regulator